MLPVVTRHDTWRANGHPLLLIGVWALANAATIAWTALVPGVPFYDSDAAPVGGAIFVSGILILFVVLGNRVGWWLASFSEGVGVGLGAVVVVTDFGLKPIGVTLLYALALWLVRSPSIDSYTRSSRRKRGLVPPPHAG